MCRVHPASESKDKGAWVPAPDRRPGQALVPPARFAPRRRRDDSLDGALDLPLMPVMPQPAASLAACRATQMPEQVSAPHPRPSPGQALTLSPRKCGERGRDGVHQARANPRRRQPAYDLAAPLTEGCSMEASEK